MTYPEEAPADEHAPEVLDRRGRCDELVDLLIHCEADCRLEVTTCGNHVSRGLRDGTGRENAPVSFC